MKISKSLLSAIAAGVLMTTAIACEKDCEETHSSYCAEDCEIDHCYSWDNCPACGMG